MSPPDAVGRRGFLGRLLAAPLAIRSGLAAAGQGVGVRDIAGTLRPFQTAAVGLGRPGVSFEAWRHTWGEPGWLPPPGGLRIEPRHLSPEDLFEAFPGGPEPPGVSVLVVEFDLNGIRDADLYQPLHGMRPRVRIGAVDQG